MLFITSTEDDFAHNSVDWMSRAILQRIARLHQPRCSTKIPRDYHGYLFTPTLRCQYTLYRPPDSAVVLCCSAIILHIEAVWKNSNKVLDLHQADTTAALLHHVQPEVCGVS
jgi:hypothetical protein